MPVFEYTGYGTNGEKTAGVIDADSPRSARARLRQQGILVTTISEDSGGKEMLRNPGAALFNRITSKDITTFTRQLSTLQTGGLTLVESLDALIEQAGKAPFKRIVTDIRERVLEGSSLADALSNHPAYFDALYVNLVRSGEASGALDKTLGRLAGFNEARLRQRAKVSAAMVYPIIMTFVGSGVLLYLLAYVTPKVQSMFEDMRQALPWPTVILLFVSNFLATWWWAILLAVIGGGFALRRYFHTDRGKRMRDRMVLHTPLFGNLARTAAIARFARALATLLGGGVSLIEALKITGKIAGNSLIEDAIDQAVINITEGHTIADPLKKSGLFPPVVTQMINAGERSGSLTDMLEKIADAYDFEVETAVSALVSLVEPALIIVMGTVVGFIVMAILLPIFELSQVVK